MALAAGHERTRSTSVPGRPPWSTGVHDYAQIWSDRPWQSNGRSEWSPTDMSQHSVGIIDRAGRPMPDRQRTRVGQSAGQPIDAFYSPFRVRTPCLFWDRIQSGFSKSLGLSGYKYGIEPSCTIFLKVSLWYSLVLIIKSIKLSPPCPEDEVKFAEPR